MFTRERARRDGIEYSARPKKVMTPLEKMKRNGRISFFLSLSPLALLSLTSFFLLLFLSVTFFLGKPFGKPFSTLFFYFFFPRDFALSHSLFFACVVNLFKFSYLLMYPATALCTLPLLGFFGLPPFFLNQFYLFFVQFCSFFF